MSTLVELEHLDCGNNRIGTLDVSANKLLQFLHCRRNQIGSIDLSENKELVDLDLSFNSLGSFDISNNTALKYFNCRSTGITNLDVAHCQDMDSLDCSRNDLLELNFHELSDSLRWLDCSLNQLQSLSLPRAPELYHLDCEGNSMEELYVFLFPKLQFLQCASNKLKSLDLRNNRFLTRLFARENELVTLYAKNGKLQSGQLTSNATLKYMCTDSYGSPDENFYGYPSDCIINNFCYYNPDGLDNNILGRAIYDMDRDGCDSEDPPFKNLPLIVDFEEQKNMFLTNKQGDYKIATGPGLFEINPLFEREELFTCEPSLIQADFTSDYEAMTQDLCISPLVDLCELDITILPIGSARPGLEADYEIIITNTGTLLFSGQVALMWDSPVKFVSADPEPDILEQTTAFWEIFNLEPFETQTIKFATLLNRPTDSDPLTGGDVLKYKVSVTKEDRKGQDPDFEECLYQTVVNSHDPNDKTCLQGVRMPEENVGGFLTYLIRFENTGSAEAINITVRDSLDEKRYIPNSLRVIEASHDVYSRVMEGNIAEFVFEDIWLSHEDDKNDGFVLVKIKTRDNMEIGDEIKNDADIYFDYNFPIITEEYVTTVSPISAQVILLEDELDVIVFPNPAREQTTIWSERRMTSLELYDLQGKRLIKWQGSGVYTYDLDVSNLAVGSYMVAVLSGDVMVTKKLVVY